MRLTPAVCLLIIYAVGIAGMLSPWAEHFVLLTPFNLLASLGFMIWAEEDKNSKLWLGLVLAGVLGWVIEAIGTNTGLLFGAYTYGATLGWQVAGTPLLMAINWAMLIYAVVGFCNFFIFSWQVGFCRRMMTSILGASLMVGLDFLIEPTAVRYDFWAWHPASGHSFFVAPLQNYLAWWGLSFGLIFGLQPLFLRMRNASAGLLLLLQAIFFAVVFLS